MKKKVKENRRKQRIAKEMKEIRKEKDYTVGWEKFINQKVTKC